VPTEFVSKLTKPDNFPFDRAPIRLALPSNLRSRDSRSFCAAIVTIMMQVTRLN